MGAESILAQIINEDAKSYKEEGSDLTKAIGKGVINGAAHAAASAITGGSSLAGTAAGMGANNIASNDFAIAVGAEARAFGENMLWIAGAHVAMLAAIPVGIGYLAYKGIKNIFD